MNLSQKAEEIFQTNFEPLMIAIQHDAQMSFNRLYEQHELFQLAVSMHLYAMINGKTVVIDPSTKTVFLK
jgi:hypothetical protein